MCWRVIVRDYCKKLSSCSGYFYLESGYFNKYQLYSAFNTCCSVVEAASYRAEMCHRVAASVSKKLSSTK